MTVGFYHVSLEGPRSSSATAKAMVASVRKAMPQVEIVQFTDDFTEPMPEVDRAMVRPQMPVALGCIDAYAQVAGEWLFLDTDVLVRENVRYVFNQPFDVAVADRAGTLKEKEEGTKFMARMPFNKGAVFSRSQAFWQAALSRLGGMKDSLQAWMGDQQAMNDVIKGGQFTVLTLPSRYNYPPLERRENVSDKAILHLKGRRKEWMREFAA